MLKKKRTTENSGYKMGAEISHEFSATVSNDTGRAAVQETCRLEWARGGGGWKDTLSGNQGAPP